MMSSRVQAWFWPFCVLLFVLFLLVVLYRGITSPSSDSDVQEQGFLNRPAPAFVLEDFLKHQTITERDFHGKVTIVNFWATWCGSCVLEHDLLMSIAEKDNIPMLGVLRHDTPEAANAWFAERGNPFTMVGVDVTDDMGNDWDVRGVPVWFVVDQKGVIRYQHNGRVTDSFWENTLKPMVLRLQQEGVS